MKHIDHRARPVVRNLGGSGVFFLMNALEMLRGLAAAEHLEDGSTVEWGAIYRKIHVGQTTVECMRSEENQLTAVQRLVEETTLFSGEPHALTLRRNSGPGVSRVVIGFHVGDDVLSHILFMMENASDTPTLDAPSVVPGPTATPFFSGQGHRLFSASVTPMQA
jgi:hypothetical protein